MVKMCNSQDIFLKKEASAAERWEPARGGGRGGGGGRGSSMRGWEGDRSRSPRRKGDAWGEKGSKGYGKDWSYSYGGASDWDNVWWAAFSKGLSKGAWKGKGKGDAVWGSDRKGKGKSDRGKSGGASKGKSGPGKGSAEGRKGGKNGGGKGESRKGKGDMSEGALDKQLSSYFGQEEMKSKDASVLDSELEKYMGGKAEKASDSKKA